MLIYVFMSRLYYRNNGKNIKKDDILGTRSRFGQGLWESGLAEEA